MRRTAIAGLLLVALALLPELATACAVCLESPWGRRGFGWPFVLLMLAPFAVAAGLAGALAWMFRRAGDAGRADRGR